ncbi:hypothetical protein EV401DRAFT_1886548 [Pisolithus croceorrhizus]|nr:hypothetical protein EV401DRAFT_1886548 [Pisolithus croceorrhizus]
MSMEKMLNKSLRTLQSTDHLLMCQFKTSGWEFYLLVEQIILNGAACGIHALNPGSLGGVESNLVDENGISGTGMPNTPLPEALTSAVAVPTLLLATPDLDDLASTIDDSLSTRLTQPSNGAALLLSSCKGLLLSSHS